MASARIIVREIGSPSTQVLERKLGLAERAWENGFLRKAVLILILAAIWETYGRWLDNDLLFPTLSATLASLAEHIRDGTIPARARTSVNVLLMGYAAGVALA